MAAFALSELRAWPHSPPHHQGWPYLGHQAAQDVEGLPPHEWQLAHGYPVHSVGLPVFLIHLEGKPGGQGGIQRHRMLKEASSLHFEVQHFKA